MKQFLAFVKKEFYHIFRDARTMIVLFGIPVVQVLLFGFVITNEIKDVPIAILDYSKDDITGNLTDKIIASDYFIITENIDNLEEIHEKFKSGTLKEAIIFEKGFAKNLERTNKANVRLIADASDPNMANMIINYTQGIIRKYTQRLNRTDRPVAILTEVRMLYNNELKGVYMFIPGIMAMILMLVSAMITSISIAREKELGTMEILLASPLSPVQIILGKVTPYLLLSFINAVVIITLGVTVFNIPIVGNLSLLLGECMLFILLALSLGILISTLTSSQQVAMMLSMFALMLPTILLSGFIFPIDNMPYALQALSQIIPPKWFIIIIKNIMLKGAGFFSVWKETLILVLMTLFFLVLSIKKFKYRLDQ